MNTVKVIPHKRRALITALVVTGFLLFLVLPAGATLEAENFSAPELALFEEVPMVYSASRIHEPLIEAPAAMSVITGEQLEQWGTVDLPDAFRYVPGVDVTAFNGREWGVTARGLNERFARRMLVLVDGMSVYTPLFSGVPWGDLPLLLEDIETIEIVRGPNDTLYGFNAFNGVINITTKSAKDTRGFFGKYTFGTQRRNHFVARYGDHVDWGSLGETDFRIAYSFHETQGYGDNNGSELPDYRHLNQVMGRVEHAFTDQVRAEFMFGSSEGPVGRGPISNAGTTYKRHNSFHYQIAKLHYEPADWQHNYIQFHHWYYHKDAKFMSAGLHNDDQKEEQIDIEGQSTFDLLDGRFQSVLGFNYRSNAVESQTINRAYDNTIQRTHDDLYSVFLNEKLHLIEDGDWIKRVTLVGGVRVEGSKLTGTDWAPRVSLLVHPLEQHSFRATYARAFRLPSFLEEFGTSYVPADTGAIFRLTGNGELKREEVNSYELGYSGIFAEGKATLDADLYLAEYTGLIRTLDTQTATFFPVARPAITQFNNSADATAYGIEVEGKIRPYSWLELFGNYTYQHVSDQQDAPALSGGPLQHDAQPSHKFNLGANIRLKRDTIESMPFLEGVSINALLNYRDSYVSFNEQNSPRTQFKIKRNIRLDLRIAKNFFEEGMEVAFIAQNLSGGDHFEADFVEVPQTFYGTVTLRSWPWELLRDKQDRMEGLIEKWQS